MHLPIGYHLFHPDNFLNYQLNRWYSLGYARKEDIEKIGAAIKSFDDYINAFQSASQLARKENRLKHAATYLRAAEFLIPPDDERKIPIYKEFIHLFDLAFSDEPYERFKIPYDGSFLSAIRIPARTPEVKGTIIGIPGFDAFIEEFYAIWDYFSESGFDCIAIEGPGQGGSRRLYGQLFDHDWEKPTKAILDHFQLDNVNAVGISMGGYWIMRAAAFEPRIKRVIAMPPVYDWLAMTNAMNRKLAHWFLKKKRLTNFMVRLKMNAAPIRHTINNALFIQNKTMPYDAVEWMMGMNKEHIQSERILQEVFLLTGENDTFQPPVLLHKQKEALINARSVNTRIFLKSEQADQHCQIGNLGLALEEMGKWLGRHEMK